MSRYRCKMDVIHDETLGLQSSQDFNKENEVFETLCFWTVQWNIQPFDNFLSELLTKAALCNFGEMKDRLIRDKIVLSVGGNLQKLLLQEKCLDLRRAIEICRYKKQEKAPPQDAYGIQMINKLSMVSFFISTKWLDCRDTALQLIGYMAVTRHFRNLDR